MIILNIKQVKYQVLLDKKQNNAFFLPLYLNMKQSIEKKNVLGNGFCMNEGSLRDAFFIFLYVHFFSVNHFLSTKPLPV